MIDTHLTGAPADIRAAAGYLLDVLSPGIGDFADGVHAQGAALGAAWEGQGGDAFTHRAHVLTQTGDDVALAVTATGTELATLASVLDSVLLQLAAVRAEAVAAGLVVRGETVLPPTAGPPVDEGHAAALLARAQAYALLRQRRDEALAQWTQALDHTADVLSGNATTLAQVTSSLLVSTYSASLLDSTAGVLSAQAAEKQALARSLQGNLDELVDDVRSGRLSPSPTFYDDLDRLGAATTQATDEAAEAAAQAARPPRLPPGLGLGLHAVGPLAAGYGVIDDIRAGESTEQAVASQGGGFLAGAAAGAVTGAAIGSFGLPVIGSAAGAVLGGAVGIVVSGEIDDRYEQSAAQEALEERQEDEELLQHLINAEAGLPPWASALSLTEPLPGTFP